MTSPAPETLEREKDELYVTDAQLIRRLGVPMKLARALLRELNGPHHPGFPRKQQAAGGRRYWPAVKLYFDRLNGLDPARKVPNGRS